MEGNKTANATGDNSEVGRDARQQLGDGLKFAGGSDGDIGPVNTGCGEAGGGEDELGDKDDVVTITAVTITAQDGGDERIRSKVAL